MRRELDAARRDSSGSLLAYARVVRAKKFAMANAEMVRRGYDAQVMTILSNVKDQALFLRLQREARQAGRGLWSGR